MLGLGDRVGGTCGDYEQQKYGRNGPGKRDTGSVLIRLRMWFVMIFAVTGSAPTGVFASRITACAAVSEGFRPRV